MVAEARMTMEAFVELVERHPEKHFEFTASGEVIEVTPKRIHSRIQALFARFLDIFMDSSPLGEDYEVLTECAHEIDSWPCRPDVSIDLKGDEQIVTTPPLLAIEIKSDSNSLKDQREKARRYLAHGTAMVWLAFPTKKIIEVYQADADDQILTLDDTLEGGAVLPGFALAVRQIFG